MIWLSLTCIIPNICPSVLLHCTLLIHSTKHLRSTLGEFFWRKLHAGRYLHTQPFTWLVRISGAVVNPRSTPFSLARSHDRPTGLQRFTIPIFRALMISNFRSTPSRSVLRNVRPIQENASARSSRLGELSHASEPSDPYIHPCYLPGRWPPYIWLAIAVVSPLDGSAIAIHGAVAASCRAGDHLHPCLGADRPRGRISERELAGLCWRRRGLRPVPGEVGGGRVVPVVRRVGVPVRAGRLRLPPQRPPRRRVPQVPVEPRQLPAAQVLRVPSPNSQVL